MKFTLLLFAFLPLSILSQIQSSWVDSVEGDFSFVENWEYPEGVYINQWGQTSCDGLCPPEIDRMKDDKGRIYDDSLSAFYSYVDTTHLFFSHEGNAHVYEYRECHYANASKVNGKIYIQTSVNIATHTSLQMILDMENQKNPIVEVYLIYNSIRNIKEKSYQALSGTIQISEKKLQKGIVQLIFDLNFQAEEGDSQYWNGKIQCNLENN